MVLERFKEMGVKPKADSKEEFELWMKQYLTPNEDKRSELKGHSIVHRPKLPIFSGTGKDSVSFDLWEFSVNCLLTEKKHSMEIIKETVRDSLRGSAARVAMRLGPGADIQHLLEKLKGLYGVVEHGESILSKFYAANQSRDEDIATWSCRIEDILEKAVEKGQVTRMATEGMLRSKLWNGLRQELKDSTRHYFDSSRSYDMLRVDLRKVEYEIKTKPKTQCKMETATASGKPTKAANVEDELKIIKGQLSQVLKAQTLGAERSKSQFPNATVKERRDRSFYRQQSIPEKKSTTKQTTGATVQTTGAKGEPQCWRCEGYGHIRLGCRVKLGQESRASTQGPRLQPPQNHHSAYQRYPLNSQRPTLPDGQ